MHILPRPISTLKGPPKIGTGITRKNVVFAKPAEKRDFLLSSHLVNPLVFGKRLAEGERKRRPRASLASVPKSPTTKLSFSIREPFGGCYKKSIFETFSKGSTVLFCNNSKSMLPPQRSFRVVFVEIRGFIYSIFLLRWCLMLLNMRRLDMIKDVPYPAQPEKPLLYAIIWRHKKVGSSSAAKKETIFKKGFQAVTYVVTVGNWTPPAFTQQHSKGVAPNLRSHAIIHNTFWPYDNSTVIGLSTKA